MISGASQCEQLKSLAGRAGKGREREMGDIAQEEFIARLHVVHQVVMRAIGALLISPDLSPSCISCSS